MGVIIRQSIKGTLANYLGIAIGFITTFFVITNYLTSEQVGLTRVLIDAAILFSSFAQLGTNSSIIRFFPYFKDEENKNHGFFFWTIVVPFIGFLIFMGVLFLFKDTIVATFSKNSPLFVQYFKVTIPLSLFMLYQSVFEANANVLMRIVVPKLVREVGVRLGLLATYLLFGFHIISLDGLVVGFCLTYLVAAAIDIAYLFTLGKISLKPDLHFITKPLLRDFLFYTLFLVVAALAGSITPLLNTFFVSAKMGLSFTGIFAIANYIATVVEIPNRSLNAIVQPNISDAVKNNDWERAQSLCRSVSLHLLLSSTFIFLIIWMNIDLLFAILPHGQEYATGKSVVFILGLARLSNSALSVGSSPLTYSKYYYLSLVFTLVLTVTAIFLNVLLIPRIGMDGAAISSFISYVIYYLLLLGLVRWKLHISVFSKAQLKVLSIMTLLFLINLGWYSTLTPIILKTIPLPHLITFIIESCIRTLCICVLTVVMVQRWKISPEVSMLISKMAGKIHRKQ